MNRICLRCYIEGHVQGVNYRHNTKLKAKELGLTGYAKNLSDGRVEVMVCGERDSVENIRDWFWDVPAADVSNVVLDEIEWQDYKEFEIR